MTAPAIVVIHIQRAKIVTMSLLTANAQPLTPASTEIIIRALLFICVGRLFSRVEVSPIATPTRKTEEYFMGAWLLICPRS